MKPCSVAGGPANEVGAHQAKSLSLVFIRELFSSLPKRSRVAIQPSKREPCSTIKEVTESTDFNCQRANLVQLWLCVT